MSSQHWIDQQRNSNTILHGWSWLGKNKYWSYWSVDMHDTAVICRIYTCPCFSAKILIFRVLQVSCVCQQRAVTFFRGTCHHFLPWHCSGATWINFCTYCHFSRIVDDDCDEHSKSLPRWCNAEHKSSITTDASFLENHFSSPQSKAPMLPVTYCTASVENELP